MPITLKDVDYVVNLAKLELSEEEKKRFQKSWIISLNTSTS
jgi:Asp-tRNA(Asn)/Glu-tRNA(Gln) amidotransferase C subunit